MRKFEYKAVPAPTKGTKAKGVKTTEDRFALSVTDVLNEMAEDGWEYVRGETLPCFERKGLTGSQQSYQNVLIFRKLQSETLALAQPVTRPEPVLVETAPEPEPAEPEIAEPEAPRLSSRPPEEGTAPTIRAVDD